MMSKEGQHTTNSIGPSEDLFDQLRQISDALWDAAQRTSLPEVNSLLDLRQSIIEKIAELKPLEDAQSREVKAIIASDKYLVRQLNTELSWLERRLKGLGQRREAAAGYRTLSTQKSYVTRSG